MKCKLLVIALLSGSQLFPQAKAIEKAATDSLTIAFYRERCHINQDSKNIDSAVYYLSLLSLTKKGTAAALSIVRGFAGSYWGLGQQAETKETIYQILKRLKAFSNVDIRATALPLFYASSVETNIEEDDKVRALVNEFINTQLVKENKFQLKIYRYGLIIYDRISTKKSLEGLANYLLNKIRDNIKKTIEAKIITSSTPLQTVENIVWTRWMYSCSNYFTALSRLKDRADNDAQKYFILASKYSTDIWSKKYSVFYYKDMIYIFKKEKSFNTEYIDYLANVRNQKENALKLLFSDAVLNPMLKPELKIFYNKYFSKDASFDTYWLENLNKIAKKAPAISLKTITSSDFSTLNEHGKWILLDFWGTWCVPCRIEHPAIESFYQTSVKPNFEKITLLTIACKDEYEKVIAYIQQSKFTFPVAISNRKIENDYKISGYPSKILITPQGKYLPIPLDTNWVDFVKYYVDL